MLHWTETLRQSYASPRLAKPDQVFTHIRDIALTGAFTYADMCQDPNHLFFIPYPDQSKEETSLISVVADGVYIPFSRSIQFCLLPSQNFEKNAQDPGDLAEPWFQDPGGFLTILRTSNSFIKEIPCHLKHYNDFTDFK